MIERKKKGLLSVILVMLLLLAMTVPGFGATVYVGNVGFNTDKLDNDAAYLTAFQNYLANHANDRLIVNAGDSIIFDANAYSNAPAGTNVVTFAANNPVSNPPTGTPWDGTGTPGEQIVSISSVTATNGTITPVFSAAAPAGLSLADFDVTATLGGAVYQLQGLAFANNAFTFTPVAKGLTAKDLVITVAAKAGSTKVSGSKTAPAVAIAANDAPAAPAVTADDTNNVIVGINATMEYSLDNGATWTAYTTAPDLSGDKTVKVRVKATDTIPASGATTLNFTKNLLAVSSVSAINATTIEATMASGTDATRAADKAEYTVKVGEETIAVSAVAYNATTKKATLTVALTGKEGSLTVNGVAASSTVDYKAPTVVSIVGVNNTHARVTFSEQVSKTVAETSSNYSANQTLTISGAVLETGNTSVLLTTSAQNPAVTYTITINNIQDVAGNTITANSTGTFGGSLAPTVSNYTVYDVGGGADPARDLDGAGAGTATTLSTSSTSFIEASGTACYVAVKANQNLDSTTINTANVKLYDVTAGAYTTFTLAKPAAAATPAGVDTYGLDTFTISKAWTTGRTYRIELETGIKNADGVPLAAKETVTFIYGSVATVTAADPDNTSDDGGTVTSNTGAVKVTFSKSLDESTLTSSNIQIRKYTAATDSYGDPIATTISFNSLTKVLSVTPTTALEGNKVYRMRIAKAIKDTQGMPLAVADANNPWYSIGNWFDGGYWEFNSKDDIFPTLVSVDYWNANTSAWVALTNNATEVYPYGGRTGAAGSAAAGDVRIVFSKPVQNIVENTDVALYDLDSGNTIKLDTANNTIQDNAYNPDNSGNRTAYYIDIDNFATGDNVTVAGALNINTNYQLVIAATVKDANTNYLPQTYTYNFKTISSDPVTVTGLRTTAANGTDTILGTYANSSAIADNAVNVSTSKDIFVTLNRDIDASTITTSTVLLYNMTDSAAVTLDVASPASNASDTNDIKYVVKAGTTPTQIGLNVSEIAGGNYKANSKYRLTIKGGSSGIKDANGNTLASDVIYYFTTGNGPVAGTTAGADTQWVNAQGVPVNVSTLTATMVATDSRYPNSGDTTVRADSYIYVTMVGGTNGAVQRNMDKTFVDATKFQLLDKSNDTSVSGTLTLVTGSSVNNAVLLKFQPTSALTEGKTYGIKVLAGAVKDALGNTNAEVAEILFTVANKSGPTATMTLEGNATNGYTLGNTANVEITFSKALKAQINGANDTFANAAYYDDNGTVAANELITLKDLTDGTWIDLNGRYTAAAAQFSYNTATKKLTITPTGLVAVTGLTVEHQYQLVLTTNIVDADNNKLNSTITDSTGSNTTFTFTVTNSDKTPPTIAALYKATDTGANADWFDANDVMVEIQTGDSNVADDDIVVRFSEALNYGTVTSTGAGTGTVKLFNVTAGAYVDLSQVNELVKETANSKYYFAIDESVANALSAGSTYRLEIMGDITDVAGNLLGTAGQVKATYNFTVGAALPIATAAQTTLVDQYVHSDGVNDYTTPAANGSALDEPIWIKVTTRAAAVELNPATVTAANVTITNLDSSAAVTSAPVLYLKTAADSASYIAVKPASGSWQGSTNYRVTLSSNIKDSEGNRLHNIGAVVPSDYSFTFTSPDEVKPTVSSVRWNGATLNNGSIIDKGIQQIVVAFSEATRDKDDSDLADNEGSVSILTRADYDAIPVKNDATIAAANANDKITLLSVSGDKKTLTLTTANLTGNTEYVLILTPAAATHGVEDASNNAMAANYVLSFSTNNADNIAATLKEAGQGTDATGTGYGAIAPVAGVRTLAAHNRYIYVTMDETLKALANYSTWSVSVTAGGNAVPVQAVTLTTGVGGGPAADTALVLQPATTWATAVGAGTAGRAITVTVTGLQDAAGNASQSISLNFWVPAQ